MTVDGREHPRDPWRRTRVGEQGDPLLPRWFAILAVVVVPIGIAVAAVAFLGFGKDVVPVAERRPAPTSDFTTDVGQVQMDAGIPSMVPPACPVIQGIRVAGEPKDRLVLTNGLSALCRRALGPDVVEPLRTFGERAGIVRFAVFGRTAVDSTAYDQDAAVPPLLFLNAGYRSSEPDWLAPLVAYEAVMLSGPLGDATTVLRARQAELTVCRTLGLQARTPGCRDAEALLALEDPAAALRAAGYR